MVFVFDLDDTICETDSYSKQYIKNFIKANKLKYKQIANTARFAERYFDWDKAIAIKWYKRYGDEMMLNFPIKTETKNFLNKLQAGGHKIIIATARARDWHTAPKHITQQWLKNNNIKYNKIYIGRIDKENICNENHADIFVDDDINILTRVANSTNTKVFLKTTNYNKNLTVPKNVIRIKSLSDMLKFIDI